MVRTGPALVRIASTVRRWTLAVLLATTVPSLAAADLPSALSAAAGTAPVAPTEPVCERVAWIDVFKHARRLRAWCDPGGYLDFSVSLSPASEGTKTRMGDRRTPEGAYRIAAPPRAGRFGTFLALDYPSRADAAEGLAEGRIDRAAYRVIVRAHERGRMPPQRTALGGFLGIHGRGAERADVPPEVDWTDGCIALDDGDIEVLAARVEVGTPVYILP